MNLVIDIGNTVAKVAVFDGVSLLEVAYDSNRNLEHLSDIYSKYHFEKAIVATVIDLSEQVLAQLALLPIPVLWLNETTPLPVVNLYETPRTLGYDRMAAVVAANEQFPGKDILVIDAGTCITYEFVDAEGRYHGGNISPVCRCVFGRFTSLPDACRWCNAKGVNFRWEKILKLPSVREF